MNRVEESNMYGFAKFVIALSQLNNGRVIERHKLPTLMYWAIADYVAQNSVEVFNFIDSMWRRFKAVVHEAWYGNAEWGAKANVKKEVAPTLNLLISEGGVLDIDGNLTLSSEVNRIGKNVRDEFIRVAEIDLNEAEMLAIKFETTLRRAMSEVKSVESADKVIKILVNILKYIETKEYAKEDGTDDIALEMELEFTNRALEEAEQVRSFENGDVAPKTVDQILREDGYKL